MRPLGKVSTKWTPELAYAVGLIATDGSLSKDGRHIDFTSKDRDLIITFRRCLGISNKIGKKKSGSVDKFHYRTQFGDILFYNWLLSIGLTPNKSKSIGALKIPDEFFFDFLRGCFDGDGTIYSFWDKRWHSSFMFYISFASSSRDYLEWLHQRIYAFIGVGGHIAASKRSQQLKYAKAASLILFNEMFYSKDLPCLRRKFIKAQKIFKLNQEHNNLPR